MKTLIIGLSKSGTTGLYYLIKNSLTGETEIIFERYEYDKNPERIHTDKHLIAKLLLFPSFLKDNYYNEIIAACDKKLLIVRDPRDNMISELIYIGGYHVTWEKSYKERRQAIKLLKEKEKNPESISMVELFQKLCDRSASELKDYTISRFDSMVDFIQRFPAFHIHYYEDFVEKNVDELEAYMGIPLQRDVRIGHVHQRVVRTKKSGAWRNWFTAEDEKFFLPLMERYFKQFNYNLNDWRVNQDPYIDPKHSSEYFINLMREKRRKMNKENLFEKILRKIFK